jgi:hypothetical protein
VGPASGQRSGLSSSSIICGRGRSRVDRDLAPRPLPPLHPDSKQAARFLVGMSADCRHKVRKHMGATTVRASLGLGPIYLKNVTTISEHIKMWTPMPI